MKGEGKPCCVYFIKCNGYIKIGISTSLAKRFQDIDGMNPQDIKILAAINFNNNRQAKMVESLLHHKFKHLNKKKEWFTCTQELQNYIRNTTNLLIEPKLRQYNVRYR